MTESHTMCPKCGAKHASYMSFCTACGTRLRDEEATPMASDSGVQTTSSVPVPAHSIERVASVRPSAAPAEAALVLVNDDGTLGARHPISQQVDIGRGQVELCYPDPYLSDRHARVVREDGGYTLLDLASVNGVYRRIREPAALTDGDFVLVGQQVLRFQMLPDSEKSLGAATSGGVYVFGSPEETRMARLSRVTTEGIERDSYYLYREQTILGRESGEIVFPDDEFLSRRHAAIHLNETEAALHDLDSSNGTFIRIRGECRLVDGDEIRVGSQLFRMEWPQ